MIREKTPKEEIIIDLTGPQGNAYSLMGHATQLAKQLGLDHEQILKDMMAGDYENLIEVFDANFGDYIILER